MIDYSIFYKTALSDPIQGLQNNNWDIFISGHNLSERVLYSFKEAKASIKNWLIFPEYGYKSSDSFPGEFFFDPSFNESEFINKYWDWADSKYQLNGKSICIDITGFLRPHLIYIIKLLKAKGFNSFDVIYSEPGHYLNRDETKFSDEHVYDVRQIIGFEGSHDSDTSKDVLIIGSGYDHQLIARIADHKENAQKFQVFGFPSLQADMYQENILRATKSEEAVGKKPGKDFPYFAPAYDPFINAQVISDIVERLKLKGKIINLYLCPLGTKPQVLGFTLYHLLECQDKPVSIIFPFCNLYPIETDVGISRIWKYTIEFI